MQETVINPKIKQYWHSKDQLHVADNVVLVSDKISIPTALRPEKLKKVHQCHLVISKCKARARTVIYWPAILSSRLPNVTFVSNFKDKIKIKESHSNFMKFLIDYGLNLVQIFLN